MRQFNDSGPNEGDVIVDVITKPPGMNVINKGEKRKIITAYNSNQIMKSEPQT